MVLSINGFAETSDRVLSYFADTHQTEILDLLRGENIDQKEVLREFAELRRLSMVDELLGEEIDL